MSDETQREQTDDIEAILDKYESRRNADEAAAKAKTAAKEELTNRVSIAAIAITMLMSFLGFARTERANASGDATSDAQHAKADAESDWSYYQTRSAERATYQLADDTLRRDASRLHGEDAVEAEVHHVEYATRVSAIDDGNRQIFFSIQELERRRILRLREASRIDYKIARYDMGTRVLTLAVVLLSVTLLANRRGLFWAAIAIAFVGAAIAVAGYFAFA